MRRSDRHLDLHRMEHKMVDDNTDDNIHLLVNDDHDNADNSHGIWKLPKFTMPHSRNLGIDHDRHPVRQPDLPICEHRHHNGDAVGDVPERDLLTDRMHPFNHHSLGLVYPISMHTFNHHRLGLVYPIGMHTFNHHRLGLLHSFDYNGLGFSKYRLYVYFDSDSHPNRYGDPDR